MGVSNVDNTKKVGGNLDLGGVGSGSSQPYMSPTDRHFASGGSIFTAPGVNQSTSSTTPSEGSGGSISGTNAAASAADGAATDADASSAASAKSTDQIKPVPVQVQGQVKAGEAKINKKTEDAVKYGDASQTQGEEIEVLQSELVTATEEAEASPEGVATEASTTAPAAAPAPASTPAPKAESAPSANPFGALESDGTGAGKDSAYSLSVGSADAPPPQEEGRAGKGFGGPHVLAARRPGLGDTITGGNDVEVTKQALTGATLGATTSPAAPAAAPTATAEGSGNTDAQEKVADLNGQIEDKTTQQEQTNQQATSAVNSVKTAYKLEAAGIKNQMAAMDVKINDAAKYEKAAQTTTLSGQAATTAGGIATATGAVYTAKGTAALTAPGGGAAVAAPLFATGTTFSIAGVSATGAGSLASVAGAGLKMHADNEKAGATAAKADIAANGKQLTQFYSKQLGKAMAADRAAGRSA